MSAFLSGVVTSGYLVIAGILAVLWYRKPDPLYRAFTIAFLLFALNQALAAALVTTAEPISFVYALRVLGFVIILGALLDRNQNT